MVSIIIGGQFGSEGKGKVTKLFTEKYHATSVVKVGGTNSGHTVYDKDGKPFVFRVLPSAAINGNVDLVLPAGSYIDVDILEAEMNALSIPEERVKIHPNAGIIKDYDVIDEATRGLGDKIGSTGSGTGECVLNRICREDFFARAADEPRLSHFICDTTAFLRDEMNQRHHVVIEGTQGFGLSVLHSPYYPYVTSRDTTAAGFLSEVGLSPYDVKNIVMVLRTYPIRVGGNSGPLPNEINWEMVTERAHFNVKEYTSVTKRLRRVAEFDADIVKRAISVNRPLTVVLNFLDYIYDEEIDDEGFGPNRIAKIEEIEQLIGKHINYVGFGPDNLTFWTPMKKHRKLHTIGY